MNEKQSGFAHFISGIALLLLAAFSAWSSSEVQELRKQIRAAVKAEAPPVQVAPIVDASGPCKCCKCEACQCNAIERQKEKDHAR